MTREEYSSIVISPAEWKLWRTGQIDGDDHEWKVPQYHEEYLPEPPFLGIDRCDLQNSFSAHANIKLRMLQTSSSMVVAQ